MVQHAKLVQSTQGIVLRVLMQEVDRVRRVADKRQHQRWTLRVQALECGNSADQDGEGHREQRHEFEPRQRSPGHACMPRDPGRRSPQTKHARARGVESEDRRPYPAESSG